MVLRRTRSSVFNHMAVWWLAGCLALLAMGCGGKESVADGGSSQDASSDGGGDTAEPDAATLDTADSAVTSDTATGDLGQADVPAGDVLVCPGASGCPCEEDEDCNDNNSCTFGELCMFEECVAGQPLGCDDGNICTDGVCDPAHGCTQTDNDAICSDLDACSEGDRCSAGVCAGKLEKVCKDGSVCTDDGCDSSQGCVFTHNKIQCKGGNECLEASFCDLGGCLSGKLKPCNDGQTCTWDSCDPLAGCQLTPVPAALACAGTVVDNTCVEAFADATAGTWQQARIACQKWGGELAVIHSKEANAAVRAQADTACKKASVWIGLTDQVKEKLWRWTDGSAPDYANWSGGEPNNAGNEDFTQMVANGRWNDIGAKGKMACRACTRPLSAPCGDGNKCTEDGACKGGKCVASGEPASCDDGNPCSVDLCAPVTGCTHELVADGKDCGLGGLCQAGACQLPNAVTLNDTSCLAIAGKQQEAPNGVYWLDPDGGQGPTPAYRAWCDMHHDGGGWTLVLKVNGKNKLLHYNAKAWTQKKAIGANTPGFDDQQAVLASYWTVPFTQVRVGLRTKGVLRMATLDHAAPSLHAVLAPGKPVATKLGLAGWKGLIIGSSLQMACHMEGFNIAPNPGGGRVRLGIIGNNENNCASPDSWLGIGGNQNQCGQKAANTAGNIACYAPNAGWRYTRSFGYVLVR